LIRGHGELDEVANREEETLNVAGGGGDWCRRGLERRRRAGAAALTLTGHG
jgi:hypothetical protein